MGALESVRVLEATNAIEAIIACRGADPPERHADGATDVLFETSEAGADILTLFPGANAALASVLGVPLSLGLPTSHLASFYLRRLPT